MLLNAIPINDFRATIFIMFPILIASSIIQISVMNQIQAKAAEYFSDLNYYI